MLLKKGRKATAAHAEIVRLVAEKLRLTCSEAADQWEESMKDEGNLQPRTIYNNMSFVRKFIRDQGLTKMSPVAVTPKHISSWINSKDKTKLSTRTLKLVILKQFCEFCSQMGYMIGNPARIMKKPNASALSFELKEVRRKVGFEGAEVDRILLALSLAIDDWETKVSSTPHVPNRWHYKVKELRFWYVAVVIARWAGLRIGDICQLEWDCFKKPGHMIVWTDKRDKRVELPLTPQLATAIGTMESLHPQYCFPEQRELILSVKRARLSAQFREILKKLKLETHTFHDLRYAYALDCKAKWISTPHIQERMGHSSVATTEHYLGVEK